MSTQIENLMAVNFSTSPVRLIRLVPKDRYECIYIRKCIDGGSFWFPTIEG